MFVFYNYFKNNIWLNFLSGIPSPGLPDRLSKYNKFFKINIAVSVIGHVFTLATCTAVVIKFHEAKDISQQVARIGMDLEVAFYIFYYTYNHKKLAAIIKEIEELVTALQTDPLTRNKDVVKSIDSEYVKLKYYTTTAFAVVSTLPTVYVIPRLVRHYGLFGTDGKSLYVVQIPYDAYYTPVYELTLFLQTTSLTYACVRHVASEAFFLSMLALLAALYKYLGEIFVDVFGPDEERGGVKAVTDNIGFERREKYTYNEAKIKTWIKFHQHVICIGNSLIRFYAPILLVYFFLLYAEVVSMTMTLTMSKDVYSNEEKGIIIVYWIVMLIDLLVLSVYGTKLADESLRVADCGFGSTWYNCSPQVKSMAKIVFGRVRRTLKPAALGLFNFDLSHESFVSILKSMASFYITLAEIKRMHEQQQQQ